MKKILAVDDSEIWLFSIRHFLKDVGFLVATYDCGLSRMISEAVGVVESENPDIILLDHLLNENFNGLELAAELSKHRASKIISTSLTIRHDGDLRKKYESLNVAHFPGKDIRKINACLLDECSC